MSRQEKQSRRGARTLAIARHESRRLIGPMLHKRTLLAMLAVAAVLALLWPLVAQRGIEPQRAIYPVGVAPGSPFAPVLAGDERFQVVAAQERDLGNTIVLWIDDAPREDGSQRGRAALEALKLATEVWLEEAMSSEARQELAFPVSVDVVSAPVDTVAPAPAPAPQPTTTSTTAGPPPAITPPAGAQVQSDVRPSEVQPPFPVRSLLLTFAYLIPMNFVGQLYAGSLLSERIRHRGVLVLSAPVSNGAVLLGRSIPYLALGTWVLVGASLLIGAGPLGLVGAIPIIAFSLAASLVLGIVARSERELTFLLTGTTTMFSTFLFLPAVFTAIPPVAFLSPVAVISASIQGQAVTWGLFLYATIPVTLSAVGLGLLARALYREETLFSPARLGQKVVAGLAVCARTKWGLLATGAMLVPFALALEMFVLAFVIPLGIFAVIPAFILGFAFVEEALKQLVSKAHMVRAGRPPWRTGIVVGTGFFLGGKLALLVAIAGFGLLPEGSNVLAVIGGGTGVFLIAPLAMHIITGVVGAYGAGKGRPWGMLALLAASVLHIAYNLAILAVGL